jgi:hypothetical protein
MVDRGTSTKEREGIRRPVAAPDRVAPTRPRRSVRRTRRKRAGIAAGVAIASAAGALLAVNLAGGHDGGAKAALALPRAGTVPVAYHITYRVTTGSVVNIEDLWVHRPFEAEDRMVAAQAPQSQPLSSIVERLGRQLVRAGGQPGVMEPPPSPPAFDVRLDAVAPDAIRAGSLVVKGNDAVAGRACRDFRTAQSLAGNTLAAKPTAANHVDSCIDHEGLVLRERRTVDGKLVQTREATAVTIGADASHTFSTAGMHIPVKQGGGAVVTISDTSRPPGTVFWELPQAPAGFTHLGRFAVVPPQAPAAPGQSNAATVTAVDDVYVRNADVVIIEQGQTLGAAQLKPPVGGREVDLGPVGRGSLELSAIASTVTVLTKKSAFVRVSGTLPPDQLVAIARALRQQPAGTIVTVPDLTSDGA